MGTRGLRLASRRNWYTVTFRTQHHQGSTYVLLFSCFIMSHSFVIPWTIACHVPLFMNTCTDHDKHTSGKMPQAALSNQRRSPFLLQCPQGTFYQQHLMSYWQQRGKKKAQSVKNPPAVQENTYSKAIWSQSLGLEISLEKEMAIQYSCLENAMDKGATWTTVHGVTESDST